jgi:hypothetical protein
MRVRTICNGWDEEREAERVWIDGIEYEPPKVLLSSLKGGDKFKFAGCVVCTVLWSVSTLEPDRVYYTWGEYSVSWINKAYSTLVTKVQ